MWLAGLQRSADCAVMHRYGFVRRWRRIFADSAIYAHVFSYFNDSHHFLVHPTYLSRLGFSTKHLQFKPVVVVINWRYYILETFGGWLPSQVANSCSHSCRLGWIKSGFSCYLTALDVTMIQATLSLLDGMDLHCQLILFSWVLPAGNFWQLNTKQHNVFLFAPLWQHSIKSEIPYHFGIIEHCNRCSII